MSASTFTDSLVTVRGYVLFLIIAYTILYLFYSIETKVRDVKFFLILIAALFSFSTLTLTKTEKLWPSAGYIRRLYYFVVYYTILK